MVINKSKGVESRDSSPAPLFLANNTTMGSWEDRGARDHLAQYLNKDILIIVLVNIIIDIY